MAIPTLICPVLNGADLLFEMLNSIDHPIDRVVIVDNGDVVVDGSEDHMIELIGLRSKFDLRIIAPGHNLGVAASWNLGMKAAPVSPYFLITNHDITFGEGDLARLEAIVDPGAAAVYHLLGFAAFAITRHALNAIGTFDENFINGYDEDVDFSRRCELANLPRIDVGWSGTHVGSATIMANPALRAWNGQSHMANDAYYARKWGGPKQGGETFDTPFNRGGHLGDWRFDFERYRNQTWPRPKKEK